MASESDFETVPFLRAVPEADVERFRSCAERRVLDRGEALWSQRDPTDSFSFVLRGRIKLIKSAETGRETALDMAGPGDLICVSAPCAFAPYCCHAVAVENGTRVLTLPRRDVLAVVERSSRAAQAFLGEIVARNMSLCRRVDEMAVTPLERRLAMLLLRLADQVGVERTGQATWIPVSLSRLDLANFCGTTLETASRVMARLARSGVVETRAQGFLITDRAALRRLVQEEGASG